MAEKNLYYVHATNEAGTSGERPEIEASSEEEAMQIYRELSGNMFPVLRAELKQQVDDDPEQTTKESQPVNSPQEDSEDIPS